MTAHLGGRSWAKTVAFVIRRDKGICWICGRGGADSADHIVPRARGGSDRPHNLAAVHHNEGARCNRYRGHKRTPEETLQRLAELGLHIEHRDLEW